MLESVRTTGGESQGLLASGNAADGKRSGSCCSVRFRFVFILVFAAIFVLIYYSNIVDMPGDWSPKWLRKNTTTEWWTRLNSSKNLTSTSTSTSAPASTDDSPAVTDPLEAQEASEKDSEPSALVPYVSPGPYLVEYPYQYHFTINEPQKCAELKPFVVLVVPVAPKNRAHRDVIRATWGSEKLVLEKTVALFFQLGQYIGEGAELLKEQLRQESREHRDLIQSDFIDCYKNLTIKTMVMLEWLDAHCTVASYAMKIDSDMFLNVPKLVEMLLDAPQTNYQTGLVAGYGTVLRNTNSKWFVPVELYPHATYPNYALGLGYVFSLDLPKKLVEAAKHVQALYIEDVYLGLCMQYLGIPPTNPPSWNYFQVSPAAYSRCSFSKIVATTTQEDADRVWMWTDFKKPGDYC